MIWKTRRQSLDLSHHGVVMGILNATPDSFSDGGVHDGGATAMAHALLMISQGAQIIDIGGESTRPGAPTVSIDQELDRVIPLISDLRKQSDPNWLWFYMSHSCKFSCFHNSWYVCETPPAF